MGFKLDLEFKAEDAQTLESGTVRIPGWYRAVLQEITEEEEKGYWDIQYRVTAGPWAGSTIHDKLWKPENAADTEKAEGSRKRIKLVLKRLGVWDGQPTAREFDLAECIDRECWLKLGERSYKGKDGAMAKSVDVEWAGIYPLDDERVPAEVRNPGSPGGVAKAGRKTATAARPEASNGKAYTPPPVPAAKPKPDYSDL